MSKITNLLFAYTGRIYVYLATENICNQFLKDAENEGFTFCDGTKPTAKHSSDILAINDDMTMNYVGFIGRMAYQAANKIGNESLVKIDYQNILNQAE